MPTNLTADDFKAVEDHLKKEYFFVRFRSETILILLSIFGIGTVAAAYAAAKAAVSKGGAAVATHEAEQARDRVIKIEQELLGTNAKTLHDKIEGLTVHFGTPRKVEHGSSYANAIVYTAPATGVMVLTDSGKDVGNGEGGIEELIVDAAEGGFMGPRAFYEKSPGVVLGERGVSHMLPARAGGKFKVWGTQETIRVYFIPLEVQIPDPK